jgi:hypothetical protein
MFWSSFGQIINLFKKEKHQNDDDCKRDFNLISSNIVYIEKEDCLDNPSHFILFMNNEISNCLTKYNVSIL